MNVDFWVGMATGCGTMGVAFMWALDSAHRWRVLYEARAGEPGQLETAMQAIEHWRNMYFEELRRFSGAVQLPEDSASLWGGDMISAPATVTAMGGGIVCPGCGGHMMSEEFEAHRCIAAGAEEWGPRT